MMYLFGDYIDDSNDDIEIKSTSRYSRHLRSKSFHIKKKIKKQIEPSEKMNNSHENIIAEVKSRSANNSKNKAPQNKKKIGVTENEQSDDTSEYQSRFFY